MPSDASLSRFGVRPAMMPWLYTPMFDHPTSSPMMKIMFGFFSCALAAGAPASPKSATTVASAKVNFGLHFISVLQFLSFNSKLLFQGATQHHPIVQQSIKQ